MTAVGVETSLPWTTLGQTGLSSTPVWEILAAAGVSVSSLWNALSRNTPDDIILDFVAGVTRRVDADTGV